MGSLEHTYVTCAHTAAMLQWHGTALRILQNPAIILDPPCIMTCVTRIVDILALS
jgi:hypothetical protein